jgi:tetratricopeptide (TPR) repeat protein
MGANVADVIKACQQKLQDKDFQAAIDLLTPVIGEPGISADDRAQALILRGCSRAESGEIEGGIADFTQAIAVARNPDHKAEALWQRAQAKVAAKEGNRRVGMEDLSEILRLPGISVEQRAQALFSRAVAMHYFGDFKGARADLTSLIELPGVSVERRATAMLARAQVKIELMDEAGELEDYNAVLAMRDVPPEEQGRAFFKRGYYRQWVTRDESAASADYNAALNVQGLSEEIREAVIKSIDTLGVDYSEEKKLVDKLKAAVKAAKDQR